LFSRNRRHLSGNKYFESSNHLGNVLVVFTDKKVPRDDNSNGIIDYFQPEVLSCSDYTAFGAPMTERSVSSDKYRYGFNGKEKDDEVSGGGNQYDYGFRIYNPRLGRFLSVDPLAKSYPWYTPYQFAGNTPIAAIDIDGLEEYLVVNYYNKNGELERSMIRMVKDQNGNIVNRNYTDANGVNHSKNLVHTTNIGPDGKVRSESFSDSFTKDQEKAIQNMKSHPLKIFLNQANQKYTDVDVYEASIPIPSADVVPKFNKKRLIGTFGFESGYTNDDIDHTKVEVKKDDIEKADKFIDDVYKILSTNKNATVVVYGDAFLFDAEVETNPDKVNADLMKARANYVKGRLIEKGVDRSRIEAKVGVGKEDVSYRRIRAEVKIPVKQ
jgi:RHS repeat-associated protein